MFYVLYFDYNLCFQFPILSLAVKSVTTDAKFELFSERYLHHFGVLIDYISLSKLK